MSCRALTRDSQLVVGRVEDQGGVRTTHISMNVADAGETVKSSPLSSPRGRSQCKRCHAEHPCAHPRRMRRDVKPATREHAWHGAERQVPRQERARERSAPSRAPGGQRDPPYFSVSSPNEVIERGTTADSAGGSPTRQVSDA